MPRSGVKKYFADPPAQIPSNPSAVKSAKLELRAFGNNVAARFQRAGKYGTLKTCRHLSSRGFKSPGLGQSRKFEDGTNLDRSFARGRNSTRNRDRLVEIGRFDQEIAAELFGCFGEGSVGGETMAAANTHTRGRHHRLQRGCTEETGPSTPARGRASSNRPHIRHVLFPSWHLRRRKRASCISWPSHFPWTKVWFLISLHPVVE